MYAQYAVRSTYPVALSEVRRSGVDICPADFIGPSTQCTPSRRTNTLRNGYADEMALLLRFILGHLPGLEKHLSSPQSGARSPRSHRIPRRVWVLSSKKFRPQIGPITSQLIWSSPPYVNSGTKRSAAALAAASQIGHVLNALPADKRRIARPVVICCSEFLLSQDDHHLAYLSHLASSLQRFVKKAATPLTRRAARILAINFKSGVPLRLMAMTTIN